jgi:hypothetical protein
MAKKLFNRPPHCAPVGNGTCNPVIVGAKLGGVASLRGSGINVNVDQRVSYALFNKKKNPYFRSSSITATIRAKKAIIIVC